MGLPARYVPKNTWAYIKITVVVIKENGLSVVSYHFHLHKKAPYVS